MEIMHYGTQVWLAFNLVKIRLRKDKPIAMLLPTRFDWFMPDLCLKGNYKQKIGAW